MLRVACLQLNPVLGRVERNISRANQLLLKHVTGDQCQLDILVLPELAFTGYKFDSRQHISPFLEKLGHGPTSAWAKEVSLRFKCHTLVGYPELDGHHIYNSAIMVSPTGDIVFNYRKTFLYQTDEEWGCTEPPSQISPPNGSDKFPSYFVAGLGPNGIRVSCGICMDLNPYKFEAPFTDYEFANSAYNQDSDLILCPMAWLASDSPNLLNMDRAYDWKPDPNGGPDLTNVRYWVQRMLPFVSKPKSRKIGFVTCNRSGWDGNVNYAGSSSIYGFTDSSTVDLYGSLAKDEENILIRQIQIGI